MELRGQPIDGSRFYRNFCCACGEPMRVVRQDAFLTDTACDACEGHPRTNWESTADAEYDDSDAINA
jgi:hypothetical protein